MVVVGIVGSRHFTDYDFLCERMAHYIEKCGVPEKVVSGSAHGVEVLAKRWAEDNGIQYDDFAEESKANIFAAGPMRNDLVIDAADELIAFPLPNSRGTWTSVGRAREKGIPVHVYRKK